MSDPPDLALGEFFLGARFLLIEKKWGYEAVNQETDILGGIHFRPTQD